MTNNFELQKLFISPSGCVWYLVICILLSGFYPLKQIFSQSQKIPRSAIQTKRPTISPEVIKLLQQTAELIQNEQFEQAEPIIRQALKLAPQNADAHNLCGIILDRRGKIAEAEREYRQSFSLNPQAVSPRANLGVLLAKAQRLKEAAAIFESVLRIAPAHPQTLINLGFLDVSTGNFSRAAELLKKANEIQPDSFDILLNLGIALFQIKQFDEAATVLQKASTINENVAEPFYYCGMIAFSRNEDQSAAEYFDKALTLNPNFAAAIFMRGEISAKNQNRPAATEFYRRALELDNTRAVYYVRLGGSYILQSLFTPALEIFQRAAAKFPQSVEIHYFLAIAARGTGNSDLASVALRHALLLKPNNTDALALSGAIAMDKGDFTTAENLLRRANSLNKNHFNLTYDLGRLLLKTRREAEALPFFKQAVLLQPNNPEIHYQLFLLYSRRKLKEEASRELEIYKQLNDKSIGSKQM